MDDHKGVTASHSPDERWPIEEHALSTLSLDAGNVRIPNPRAGESSIAAYMVEAEDIAKLALSICQDGYIDNEVPVVVDEKGRLVVLEGNRRITALKLLTGTLLPDQSEKEPYTSAEIERIGRRYPRALRSTIRVMIAPSREAAQPLLARLHTANPKRSWLREQQSIFYHAQLTRGKTVDDLRNQFPSVRDIPRFIQMGEMRTLIRELDYADEELKDWVMANKLPWTSFEYIFRSADYVTALGLQFNLDGQLTSGKLTTGQDEALQYLLSRIKARTLNTRSPELKKGDPKTQNPARQELLEYLRSLVGWNVSSDVSSSGHSSPGIAKRIQSRGAPPRDFVDGVGVASHESASSSVREESPAEMLRAQKRGAELKKLDLQNFKYPGASGGLRRRIEELGEINVIRFPNAAYDLLRTILECSGKIYLRKHNPGRLRSGSNLNNVLIGLKGELSGDKLCSGILSQIEKPSPKSSGEYAATSQSLNAMNHEPEQFATGQDVHEAWDRLKPLLTKLLGG